MPASLTVSTDANPRKLSLEQLGHLQRAQRRFVRKYHGGGKDYRRHKRAAEETLRRKIKIPRKQAGLPVEAQRIRAAFARDPIAHEIAADSLILAFLPRETAISDKQSRHRHNAPNRSLGQRRRAAAARNRKELKRRLRKIDWGLPVDFVIDAPLEKTRRGAPRPTLALRLLPHIGAVLVPANIEKYRRSLTEAGMRLMKPGKVRLIEPVGPTPASDGDQPDLAQGKAGPVSVSGRGTTVRTRNAGAGLNMARQSFDSLGLTSDRRGRGGRGVVIGILDTGVFALHEQFEHKEIIETEIGPTGIPCDVTRYDHPHGTQVAALAAGRDGVAPEATLLSARVLTNDGWGENIQVAVGLNWLIREVEKRFEESPLIICASLGTTDPELVDAINDTVEVELEEMTGIFAIAAAGNGGASRPVDFPAAMDAFIAVGALKPDGTIWASTQQAGSGVDIFAPGVDIVSAGIAGPASYIQDTGTSMAVPLVAGVIARLVATDSLHWMDQSIQAAASAVRDDTARNLTFPMIND